MERRSPAFYLNKLPKRTRTFVQTCIYGLAAGLAAVLFHLAIHWLFHSTFEQFAEGSLVQFLCGSFITIMVSSLVVGYLLNQFCFDARGSGIPQLKLAFWKDFGYVPWRVVWVKFIAGALSVGGGCSLGREGPSVQLAGALSSNLAGALGESKQNRRNASAAGAAAGLAAAFNTPLAAMTFVLEEIVGDLNSRFLGSVLLASVIGAFVVHGIIGEQPAFTLNALSDISWTAYLLIPFVAAMATAAGWLFQKWTLKLRMRRKTFQQVPLWMRPAIGGLITWALGCAVFVYTGRLGIFGLGYSDLSDGLSNLLDWRIAGVLLAVKLIATFACYGFGGCGGIFSPTLFFGGMAGVFLSGFAVELGFDLSPDDRTLLAVVGMSSCLGAVVRAPVTGIMIVFEMTHEFSLVPALMVGTLVSEAISRRLSPKNFYEEVLEQDGHNLEHVIPPRDLQSWQQLPISAIANFQPVVLEDPTPEVLERYLENYPYNYFPVVQEGKLAGILSRQKARTALDTQSEPVLQKAVTVRPAESIRRLQNLLIESTTGVVVLVDKEERKILGILTLHDLLRAQVSMAREDF